VTEIPEHLLKRSKERRAAMGLPGGESDAPASSSSPDVPAPAAASAPVAARAATPEPAAPPPPKPVPAHVAAAYARRRIPYWAMPVLALLPLWGLLYWNSVRIPPNKDAGLIEGATVYVAQCSACHGATGQGGAGAQLNQGEVLKTFKDPKDMMMWIYLGKAGGQRADDTYGDCNRPGGPHSTTAFPTAMPAHANMTASDLADVTRYIRETLSGEAIPDAATITNYPTIAAQAIAAAKAGQLPSAATAKGTGAAATCSGSATKASSSSSASGVAGSASGATSTTVAATAGGATTLPSTSASTTTVGGDAPTAPTTTTTTVGG
jgi:mono/diheme cytochrome c family protein